uniref:Uncharacterized protein n=1 Tax=Rhizophora mucronata TaxID=61149 RepID=A0A2P2MHF5_RHIMU
MAMPVWRARASLSSSIKASPPQLYDINQEKLKLSYGVFEIFASPKPTYLNSNADHIQFRLIYTHVDTYAYLESLKESYSL